jgi:Uma2 family endonuclease
MTAKQVTVEELWELREEPFWFALIDGQLHRMPGTGGTHGATAVKVTVHLDPFVEEHDLGQIFADVGLHLFPDRLTTLFPDVAFVGKDGLPGPDELERFLTRGPDLAVEISSPTDYPKLLADKLATYAEARAPLVWVLYPGTKSVHVYRFVRKTADLKPDETLDGGDVLPGFAVRVGALFPS